MPLLFRHIQIRPEQVVVLNTSARGAARARQWSIQQQQTPLTEDNHVQVLNGLLVSGDFLLNLSVNVSSLALMVFCRTCGVLYLDTCLEPWAGGYTERTRPPAQRTNYALREAALALRGTEQGQPTAVITHGANPGLVSHLLKQALLNLAQTTRSPQAAACTPRASAMAGPVWPRRWGCAWFT